MDTKMTPDLRELMWECLSAYDKDHRRLGTFATQQYGQLMEKCRAALAQPPSVVGEAMPERYEAQHMIGAFGDFRITDKTTDSRIATCYLKEHAELVVEVLNAYALSLREKREGWTSVSEKVPDLETRVLVWDANNEGGGEVLFGCRSNQVDRHVKGIHWRGENTGYDGDSAPLYGVTHWMPLPAAPSATAAEEEEK